MCSTDGDPLVKCVFVCGLSASDCKGEESEDTFTGLKVVQHSFGLLLYKGLGLFSSEKEVNVNYNILNKKKLFVKCSYAKYYRQLLLRNSKI